MQRMVVEVIALIIAIAFFAALLSYVTISGAEPLGYILVILAFLVAVSIAGTRIASHE